ncbi:MAG: ferrous iron transport protein A [Chlorobi bacterium]|nr:ferrous iron transport protein A [Chlorobiota bacterium]
MTRLDQLPSGIAARIVEVHGTAEFVERMSELGLIPGTVVEVVRRSPLGGAVQIRYRSTTLALRLSDNHSIIVETVRHRNQTTTVQAEPQIAVL